MPPAQHIELVFNIVSTPSKKRKTPTKSAGKEKVKGDSSYDLLPKKSHLRSSARVQSTTIASKASSLVTKSMAKKESKSTKRKLTISPTGSKFPIPVATEKQILMPSLASKLEKPLAVTLIRAAPSAIEEEIIKYFAKRKSLVFLNPVQSYAPNDV